MREVGKPRVHGGGDVRDVQRAGHVHRHPGSAVSVCERAVESRGGSGSVCVCDERQMDSGVSGVVVDAGEGVTSIIPVVGEWEGVTRRPRATCWELL